MRKQRASDASSPCPSFEGRPAFAATVFPLADTLHRRRFLGWLGTAVGGAVVSLPVHALAREDDILRRAKKIVVEHFGVPEDRVTVQSHFIDDLAADSLDTVELIMAFEAEFEIEIPDDIAEMIETLGDFVDRYPSLRPARGKSERTKRRVNIGTIGQVGHGKTALTAAITKYFGEFRAYDVLDAAPVESARGISIAAAHVEYETDERHYAHIDCRDHADCVKIMITGAAQMDGAILVVDATTGPGPQTREHILLARQTGIAWLVVFLNKIDLIDDRRVEQVEMEVRELLSSYGYPGEDIQVVAGSALAALEGRDPDIGEAAIRNLMKAVDESIQTPERLVDRPFLLPIEDVFSISGRGTVVTGRIERGVVCAGDKVEIVGIRETRATTVLGVEMFRKVLDCGVAGDNVGLLLKDLQREDVERGQVVTTPGAIRPHARFESQAYILTKQEGGRHTPFFANYRPQFYFRTTDVTGTIELPSGTEMVMPGDVAQLTVTLIAPIAMEEKLRFAIREGGRTVGAGVVTRMID